MIDSRGKTGRTALSWAVELGNLEITESLLIKGADPNTADNRGYTPIFYCPPKVEILGSLLCVGANVNHVSRLGNTKIHDLVQVSDQTDILEHLWRHGADLNYQAKTTGMSPLHVAIAYGMRQTVYWLLQKDVNIDARDSERLTPLAYAIASTNVSDSIAWLLEKSVNYHFVDAYGEGLLHYVARYGSIAGILTLKQAGLSGLNIRHKSNRGCTPYKRCLDSQTPMDIAEERRDHNMEWARDSLSSPDPDPQAWFTAFQALVDSIQASSIAEHFGDFWGGLDEAETSQHIAESVRTDEDYLPALPGAYVGE